MVGMAQGSPQGGARVTAGCNLQAGLTRPGPRAGFFIPDGLESRTHYFYAVVTMKAVTLASLVGAVGIEPTTLPCEGNALR